MAVCHSQSNNRSATSAGCMSQQSLGIDDCTMSTWLDGDIRIQGMYQLLPVKVRWRLLVRELRMVTSPDSLVT